MFESYVVGNRVPWSRRLWIVGSIAIHAVALVAAIAYSSVQVEEIVPPTATLRFFSAPPPPPPPPPPPAAAPAAQTPAAVVHPKHATKVATIVQPKEIPKTPPQEKIEPPKVEPTPTVAAADTNDKSKDNGSAGGTPGAAAGGTPGGLPGGQGVGPAGPVKPKAVSPHFLDTQALYRPDPHVPEAIKAQRRGGGEATFVAKVCVSAAGKVFSIDVREGIDGADDAIKATIMTWAYKPQPIPVCFIGNWIFTFE